jgi:hypothetical protein
MDCHRPNFHRRHLIAFFFIVCVCLCVFVCERERAVEAEYEECRWLNRIPVPSHWTNPLLAVRYLRVISLNCLLWPRTPSATLYPSNVLDIGTLSPFMNQCGEMDCHPSSYRRYKTSHTVEQRSYVDIYLTYWRGNEGVLYSSEIWNLSRYLTNSFPKGVQNLLRVTSNSSPTRVLVNEKPGPIVF